LYKTALRFEASAIIRITADCPLIDPLIIDNLIKIHFDNRQYDIITNCKTRTFPHGLDTELYTLDSLKEMWTQIKQPEVREWFPFFIDKNPSLFKIYNVENDKDLSYLRWTLDYPEDYQLIMKIYDSLFREDTIFTTKDILQLYEKNPQLKQINSKYSGYHNVGAPNI
jgi:spore coat polysaccharide biosynthesis protein SpsF